jgi:hypothetical protein
MRDKQGKIERATFELRQERLAEPTQTGARIQNDDVASAADLYTGGVTTVAKCARSWRGY